MSFTGMRFRWPWRNYQARVLEALEGHLADRRLHVVAAPGSGKTVLGLELFRRLASPTLVLSPTRTIRDQWVERLRDFLPVGEDPFTQEWQSRDLDALATLNSLTYQALHTRVRLESVEVEGIEAEELEAETSGDAPSSTEIGEVAARLKSAGIKVLILDEAHHLRSEWWSALQEIVHQLGDVTIISLTATPPYDVAGREWERYVELCGPIDEEISVPELVKSGTLCPHQDFLWLVRCEGREVNLLQEHRNQVTALLNELSADTDFLAECRGHAWVAAPGTHIAELIEAPREAVALCALLVAAGHTPIDLMEVLDLQVGDVPLMGEGEWESILRLYLFGGGWSDTPETDVRRKRLARRMRADRLLWRSQLAIVDSGKRWPQLSCSADKVSACIEIYRLEYDTRGDTLRQVILTDFIRDEEYAEPVQRELTLGAWPVFYRLAREASPSRIRTLVLHTGRLSIVHRGLLDIMRALPECPDLLVREVPALNGFSEVRAQGGKRLTRVITRLLTEGHVHVLVGTRALLGEGWDAPPVNSLVLASVIGSFMTTNQMRGRAIRVDPAQPGKVASIWHLGAFAELMDDRWDIRDLQDMKLRFETFVGLAHDKPLIEGGLERLCPGFLVANRFNVPIGEAGLNRAMAARLRDRDDLARRWREAIQQGQIGQVVPSVHVPSLPRFNPLDFHGTLATLLLQLVWVGLTVFWYVLTSATHSSPIGSGTALVLLIAAVAALVVVFPRFVRLINLYLRYLPVDGAVRAISLAVRDALCECGMLPAHLMRNAVIISKSDAGGFHIALNEGSLAERALFADCLSQVLGPIDRPRYLITRQLSRRVGRERDYHAVPAQLGVRNDRARIFLDAWRKHVSNGDLIYARGDEGRKMLAQARVRTFSSAAHEVARRMDRWI